MKDATLDTKVKMKERKCQEKCLLFSEDFTLFYEMFDPFREFTHMHIYLLRTSEGELGRLQKKTYCDSESRLLHWQRKGETGPY